MLRPSKVGQPPKSSREASPSPSGGGDCDEEDVSLNTFESATDQDAKAKGAGGDDSKSSTSTSPKPSSQPPSRIVAYLNSNLSPRWVNWMVRLFTAILLITGFSLLVYWGPLALVFLVLVIQLGCFKEIINIGLVVYRMHDLPWFRILSWQFLFTSNYFLFGESIISHFRLLLARENFLQPLITHHRFISYTLYSIGLIVFVLSLVKKRYLQQFLLFGWTHVTLLLIVFSSHFIVGNIFNGIAWFVLPVGMVICNDIMAYIFGFFYGKTPLIQLSPKKTWEGFIGGGLSTILFGLLFAVFLVRYDSFVCPLEWDESLGQLTTSCVRNQVFNPRSYNISLLPEFLPVIRVTWYPFWSHALIIALYVSIVGPFGGFFASGFKRAFRLKDFGDLLPGHGGIMDRFDCQLIVGVFVYLYHYSFIHVVDPRTIISVVKDDRTSTALLFQRIALVVIIIRDNAFALYEKGGGGDRSRMINYSLFSFSMFTLLTFITI